MSTMESQTPHADKSGTLEITGGVKSEEAALAIKAGLEDLPGVHAVEFIPEGVRIHFNADLANEQKFYEAVKIAGYHASTFRSV
jgi:hypothetical protein